MPLQNGLNGASSPVKEKFMSATMTAPKPTNEPSQRRVTTNRRNARKSTGPRSAKGKAAVAMNALGHGILALCPVIDGLESLAEWKRFRREMVTGMAPVGAVEWALVERIGLAVWRLRRTVRYETEQIRLAQEGAMAHVGSRVLEAERSGAVGEVQEALANGEFWESVSKGFERLAHAKDDEESSDDHAWWFVSGAYEQLGLGKGDAFDTYWDQLPKPPSWTMGWVRQRVQSLAEANGKTLQSLSAAMEQDSAIEAAEGIAKATEVKRSLDAYQRSNLLPDEGTLEKVMRYEAHLSRQFHRDLHELQRLQAMRHGLPVSLPVAIDVEASRYSPDCPATGG